MALVSPSIPPDSAVVPHNGQAERLRPQSMSTAKTNKLLWKYFIFEVFGVPKPEHKYTINKLNFTPWTGLDFDKNFPSIEDIDRCKNYPYKGQSYKQRGQFRSYPQLGKLGKGIVHERIASYRPGR